MLFYPLTNFEIQKYYENEPKFKGVCSRISSPKTKDETYLIKSHEYKSAGTYWIALFVNGNNAKCLDNFRVEHIPRVI